MVAPGSALDLNCNTSAKNEQKLMNIILMDHIFSELWLLYIRVSHSLPLLGQMALIYVLIFAI